VRADRHFTVPDIVSLGTKLARPRRGSIHTPASRFRRDLPQWLENALPKTVAIVAVVANLLLLYLLVAR
jgi:hypothetical protein